MVNTRAKTGGVRQSAAELAIARGGNRQLKKMLGVQKKKQRRRGGSKNKKKSELEMCRERVAKLERILEQIRGGKAKAQARRARKPPSENFTSLFFNLTSTPAPAKTAKTAAKAKGTPPSRMPPVTPPVGATPRRLAMMEMQPTKMSTTPWATSYL